MINVYPSNPEQNGYDQPIIARVQVNTRLDTWDGRNFTNGGTGLHKGITKLKRPVDADKAFVIIISSQWQGAKPYAYCVTAEEAASEIMKADAVDSSWVWPEIKSIIKKLEDCEEDQLDT